MKFRLFSLALLPLLFVGSAFAVCRDASSPLTALLAYGNDDGKKTPLILIHGHQAVNANEDVTVDANYWNAFLAAFQNDSAASAKFTPYLFQYCSDREPVAKIAEQLRDAIDAKLKDRQHVIVAHSLGGLVATSYMAETTHASGTWKGKRGGDTVLGVITLATPHHGTPGANDASTMSKFVPRSLSAAYDAMHRIYWRSGPLPTAANRSDLRWDNYDGKLPASSKDINSAQAKRNAAFAQFTSKLIAYAGAVDSTLDTFELASLLLQLKLGNSSSDDHSKLSLANVGLVNALGNKFGNADGLVPQVSGLFCRAGSTAIKRKNYICTSTSRVRRFEFGTEGSVPAADLPDANTLSIIRTARGFDHLNMLTNSDVLKHVLADIGSMLKPNTRQTLPTRTN
ncbi:MAG TPA: hypothetical protein PKA82_05800 [Pyrinomonadaceae bacterium]|nr:hypothetical protein [Pyrinomonadaceae bacterium]